MDHNTEIKLLVHLLMRERFVAVFISIFFLSVINARMLLEDMR